MENISLEKLGFTNRTKNALLREKVNTLELLMRVSEEELLKIRNMGKKSAQEVLDFQKMIRENGENLTFLEEPTPYVVDEPSDTAVINVAYPNTTGKRIVQMQYRIQTGSFKADIGIVEAGLSVRTTNALTKGGYKTINEVAFAEYELISQLKNMGAKSVAEVVEYFRLNVKVTIMGEVLSKLLQELYEYIVELNENMECAYPSRINECIKILLAEKEEEINSLKEELSLQELVESE